jgi:hypothetical protein
MTNILNLLTLKNLPVESFYAFALHLCLQICVNMGTYLREGGGYVDKIMVSFHILNRG